MKKIFKEFKEFALKGNVIELAIAVIIGEAFSSIVKSLVDDMFLPLIGILIGGIGISDLTLTVGGAVLRYGNLLQNIIIFLIQAFVLFLLIKGINAIKSKFEKVEENKELEEVKFDVKEELLKEIRDLLKCNL